MKNVSEYLRVWAEIDLGAVRYNLEKMHAVLKEDTQIICVLKTNAYGHGAVKIAQMLEEIPYVWGYAAATFEEAAELRRGGAKKPILLLGYVFPYCYERLATLDVRPAVFREDMLEQLEEAYRKTGQVTKIHVAVDTGMSRIGITPDEKGLSFVRKVLSAQGVELEGLFTHFARADEYQRETTQEQIAAFTGFEEKIRTELGYNVPLVHASNSAGIIVYPEANLDLVRAGITLYGLWPSDEVPTDIVPLHPVMSLRSSVVYVKDVPVGTPVSYGGTYVTTEKSTRIATIPTGYGDGYPRSLSNKGYVLINGQRAPILGRVCMDQLMVDVTNIVGVHEGSIVTLLGTDGKETITMEMLGDLSGRFNYEFACDINPRVPRITAEG